MVRLKRFQFIVWAVKRFFSSVPQLALFALTILSGYLIYRCDLLEGHRAIFEGVVSGYIFYWFVDVLPKFERNAANVKKIANELLKVLNYIRSLRSQVLEEVLAAGHHPKNQQKFYELLENMLDTHMPITNSMQRITATTAVTATQPLQFHYGNMETVMQSELIRIVEKLRVFERAAAIYGLADIDTELMQTVSDVAERRQFSNSIQALAHVKNTPAVFGTELDLIEGALIKIKTKLEADWRIQLN